MKKVLTPTSRFIIVLMTCFTLACDKDKNSLPDLQTLQVRDVCPESALGGGKITSEGLSKVTSKGLVWKKTELPTISDHDGITDEGESVGEFLSQLTHLLPNTKYFVRAYAQNSHGLAYGMQVTFTTLKENTAADIDGNIYRTVKIGNQEWFAENLRVTRFSDGTLIRGDLSDYEWTDKMLPGYLVYPHENIEGINSDEEMRSVYGLLYNGYAASHKRGLCPSAGGWRVATYDDWNQLTEYLQNLHGENVADRLKSCRQIYSPFGEDCSTDIHPRWDYHFEHYGTDDFGFSALPAGYRSWTGPFMDLGNTGTWWCYDMNPQTGHLYYMFMKNDWGIVANYNIYRWNGFSVRCVRCKDAEQAASYDSSE